VVYLVYLYIRAPERVTEVGLVPLDLEPDSEPALAGTSEE
jgi:hypothetical protein